MDRGTAGPEPSFQREVAKAVHGIRMCNTWLIVGDDNLEHSKEHVLFRNVQPVEVVYVHTRVPAGAVSASMFRGVNPWSPCGRFLLPQRRPGKPESLTSI